MWRGELPDSMRKPHPAFSYWAMKEGLVNPTTEQPCLLWLHHMLTSLPTSSFTVGCSRLWFHAPAVQSTYSLLPVITRVGLRLCVHCPRRAKGASTPIVQYNFIILTEHVQQFPLKQELIFVINSHISDLQYSRVSQWFSKIGWPCPLSTI